MRVLIAPNAFKHSLDAGKAARAIRQGLMLSNLDCSCACFPIGDGGDGTAALIVEQCGGEWVETAVHDPLGRPMNARFGWISKDQTAVIEMAAASGLRLLQQEELNPLMATSFGTGEQIRWALEKGARKIIIAMGGSATVDGGTGILQALGIRFLNAAGEALGALPGDLIHLAELDFSGLDARVSGCAFIVLCDVVNKLLGPDGAAAVFGPQKGASPEGVQQLDAALAQLSATGLQQTGRDGAVVKHGGTAGGAAAGLFTFLDARLVNGIEYFLDLTAFDKALENADLVITGEGSIDEQTLQGKAPFGVARRARLKGIKVVALAGKVPLEKHPLLQSYFDVIMPICHQPLSLPEALASTENNLIRTAEVLGNVLTLRQ